MWSQITERFDDQPAKQEVVKFILKQGFSVTPDDGINVDGVSITNTELADRVGVDRRVVSETAEEIVNDPELRPVFENLSSIPFIEQEAPVLGLSVVTVQVSAAASEGLLSSIAAVFDEHGVMIRQAVVEDPFFTQQPQFVAIVDDPVPGDLVIDLDSLENVTAVFYSSYDG